MRRTVAAIMVLLTVQSSETVTKQTQVVVRGVPVVQERMETPIADSRIDWEEQDRQNECLWEFLQASGVELTLQSVLAAGEWTDALGGACQAIGED